MKQKIHTDKAPKATGPFSQAQIAKMKRRIIVICNSLLVLFLGLNILTSLITFSDIDSLFTAHLGYIGTLKYHIFLFEYVIPISSYALGVLIFITGVRLLIANHKDNTFGLIFAAIPITLLFMSFLERLGILINTYIVS